jgi:hypothetical protein
LRTIPVYLADVAASGLLALAVGADVVGLQRTFHIVAAAVPVVGKNLGTAVDVFCGILEIAAAAETAPVFGPHLGRTHCADVGADVLAERAFRLHQAGQQIRFDGLTGGSFQNPAGKFRCGGFPYSEGVADPRTERVHLFAPGPARFRNCRDGERDALMTRSDLVEGYRGGPAGRAADCQQVGGDDRVKQDSREGTVSGRH